MSIRNISWGGRGGWCIGLTTLPPLCADCHEIWEPHPPETLRAFPGPYRDCFTFALHCYIAVAVKLGSLEGLRGLCCCMKR